MNGCDALFYHETVSHFETCELRLESGACGTVEGSVWDEKDVASVGLDSLHDALQDITKKTKKSGWFFVLEEERGGGGGRKCVRMKEIINYRSSIFESFPWNGIGYIIEVGVESL